MIKLMVGVICSIVGITIVSMLFPSQVESSFIVLVAYIVGFLFGVLSGAISLIVSNE